MFNTSQLEFFYTKFKYNYTKREQTLDGVCSWGCMFDNLNLILKEILMKAFDVVVALLLVIGGLNWGLVGLFSFDLVASILGNMTALSRIIYIVVGISAVYQAIQWKSIQKRWGFATVENR